MSQTSRWILIAAVLVGCGNQEGSGPPQPGVGGAGAGGTGGAAGGAAGNATGGAAGSATGGAAGSGTGGGGTSGSCGSTLDADAACSKYAASFCAYFGKCAPELLSDFDSNATCVERSRLRCMVELDAPGSRVKPALYVAAADIYDATSCEPIYSFKNPLAGILESSDACGQAGTLADGSACYVDQQCAGMICSVPKGAACGTCTSLGQLGDACEVDADCDDAHYCVGLKCNARLGLGQTCGANPQCGKDAHCASGTCQPRLGVGGTCALDSDCESGLVCGASKQCKKPSLGTTNAPCAPLELLSCNGFLGFKCDSNTMTCIKAAKAASGQACGLQGSVYVACADAATCVLKPDLTGTCVALAKEPASCNLDMGPECLSPAVCAAGSCVIPDKSTCP